MILLIFLIVWECLYWQLNDEEIVLQFYVFGEFEVVCVLFQFYGSLGLLVGIILINYYYYVLCSWEGYLLKGLLGKLFKEELFEVYQCVVDVLQVLVVCGMIKDIVDIGYLCDVMGVLVGLLDIGGVVIFDLQIFILFDVDGWCCCYLVCEGVLICSYLLILCDGEFELGCNWIYICGMCKFGCFDFSLCGVLDDQVNFVGSLCE